MSRLRTFGAVALFSVFGMQAFSQRSPEDKSSVNNPQTHQHIVETRLKVEDTLYRSKKDSLLYYTTKSENTCSPSVLYKFNDCSKEMLISLGDSLESKSQQRSNTQINYKIYIPNEKGEATNDNKPNHIISFQKSFLPEKSFDISIDGTGVGHIDFGEGDMDLSKDPQVENIIASFLAKFINSCRNMKYERTNMDCNTRKSRNDYGEDMLLDIKIYGDW